MSFANLLGPGGYISSAYLPARALSDELVLENADTTEITLVAGGQSSAELNCAGGLLVNATGGTVAINSAAGQITMPKPGTSAAEGILFFPDTANTPFTAIQMEAFTEGTVPTARLQMVPNGGAAGVLFSHVQPIMNTYSVSAGTTAIDQSWCGYLNWVTYSGTGEAIIQLSDVPNIEGQIIDIFATGPLSSANRIRIEVDSTLVCYITAANTWTRLFYASGSNWYGFLLPSAPTTV